MSRHPTPQEIIGPTSDLRTYLDPLLEIAVRAEADHREISISELLRKATVNWLSRNMSEATRHRLWWERNHHG